MANGFFMSQAPQLDYRPLIQSAGAPAAGIMGGIQSGLQMRAQMQEMAAREAEQDAATQQATRQEDIDALAMQASQGDPEAMQQLSALDPQAALQMQQITQMRTEQARQEEQDVIEEIGRVGSLMATSTTKTSRAVYNRAYERIVKEGGDITDFGLPTRAEAEELSNKELDAAMKEVAPQLEAVAMGPEKAAQLRAAETEREAKRQERLTKAAEEGKIEQMPAIKDPSSGRKEFTGLSKVFNTVSDSYRRIQAAAEQPSAAGDLALIFNYMKMLDPGSVVREGEFATAQNAAGIPERIRAQYNKVFTGERLTENTRKDFLGQAKRQINSAIKKQVKTESTFKELAERSKIAPEDVVIDFIGDLRPKKKVAPGLKPEDVAAMEVEGVAPQAPAGPGKTVTEQRQAPDGRTIVRYSDGTMAVF